LSQDCPGGQEGSAQQVSSTQLPDMQSASASQAPPFGAGVRVGVAVGVLVAVAVGVTVGVRVGVLVGVLLGVTVGVLVGVRVGVAVGVSVGLLVGVLVGVCVGVEVGVTVGVSVGVLVGVALGAIPAHVPSHFPNPVAVWRHRLVPVPQSSATPFAQSGPTQHPLKVAPISAQKAAHPPQLPVVELVQASWLAPSHMQQSSPCAIGTEAKVASVVTAVMDSPTKSDRCAREIERREVFRSVLSLIQLLSGPRQPRAGHRPVSVGFRRARALVSKCWSTVQGEHQRTAMPPPVAPPLLAVTPTERRRRLARAARRRACEAQSVRLQPLSDLSQ
jgi:hypothetical protein